ncbi:hypothetical protein FOA52_002353 [Chlamydomonas sp. UWO 241]|nr:hypothetical protein FOA52_002353 [Chlamydomonas sp. UWO 241]
MQYPGGANRHARPLTADELVRNVTTKLSKAGLDIANYTRQIKDIGVLFESGRIELITEGENAGAWEMFCHFKNICHCFHSAREVAATFGIAIPASKGAPPKRRREDERNGAGAAVTGAGYSHSHGSGLHAHTSSGYAAYGGGVDFDPLAKSSMPRGGGSASGGDPTKRSKLGSHNAPSASFNPPSVSHQPPSLPPHASTGRMQKTGRMGSRFQNQKLVKAINSHVGMEVTCGDLVARVVNANLSGMMFELLDAHKRPTGDLVPPSQLAKRSCLAHQNNAWKSIKVDGITLDSWVCRLQDEVDEADGVAGRDRAGLQAAMFMHAVDAGQRGFGRGGQADTSGGMSGSEDDEGYDDGDGSDGAAALNMLSGAVHHTPGGGGGSPEGRGGHGGGGGGLPASGGGGGGGFPAALAAQLMAALEDNAKLRARRDRLEQLMATKNQEIAESIKSVVEARREASSSVETSARRCALLEDALASERSARQAAEAALAERASSEDKLLQLSVNVVDLNGSNLARSEDVERERARSARLHEALAGTAGALAQALGELRSALRLGGPGGGAAGGAGGGPATQPPA